MTSWAAARGPAVVGTAKAANGRRRKADAPSRRCSTGSSSTGTTACSRDIPRRQRRRRKAGCDGRRPEDRTIRPTVAGSRQLLGSFPMLPLIRRRSKLPSSGAHAPAAPDPSCEHSHSPGSSSAPHPATRCRRRLPALVYFVSVITVSSSMFINSYAALPCCSLPLPPPFPPFPSLPLAHQGWQGAQPGPDICPDRDFKNIFRLKR